MRSRVKSKLEYHPVTKGRWADFEELFGKSGAYGGCWCMWWRSKRSEFETRGNAGNRVAIKDIIDSGTVPGILIYVDDRPAAWCSIAPREQYGSLNRSHVLKRIDDTPVWSLVCLFVAKEYRKQGITRSVIRSAIDYVRSQGGKVVEAYPTLPKEHRLAPVSSFMGLPAMYEKEGFVEVARPSESKVVLRYTIS
jgi:GNAT superfamily N-acetyltransferase